MLTSLRYALATFCFAASVGCLALWWRSTLYRDIVFVRMCSPPCRLFSILTIDGLASVGAHASNSAGLVAFGVRHDAALISRPSFSPEVQERLRKEGAFGGNFGGPSEGVHFPLWYPALVFALVGVGASRLGRRFTLRSAIIATTAVAGLLGMATAM